MASNNRKLLYPYQPGQSFTLTFYIPWSPPPPPLPPPQRDLFVLLSTSICIIGAVLLLLLLAVFFYLYIRRSRRSSPAAVAPVSTNRREDENEERGERDLSRDHHFWHITTRGLRRSEVDSITVVVFKKGEGVIDGTDCSVCLSEFEEDESLRLLPKCSHAFHVSCIDTWLLSHRNCPLCRAPVFSSNNEKTETNHQTESGTSNGDGESSGSRNANILPRSQSDLASHCGRGRLETVRRSFSIGGSSLVKAEGSDFVAGILIEQKNKEPRLGSPKPNAFCVWLDRFN